MLSNPAIMFINSNNSFVDLHWNHQNYHFKISSINLNLSSTYHKFFDLNSLWVIKQCKIDPSSITFDFRFYLKSKIFNNLSFFEGKFKFSYFQLRENLFAAQISLFQIGNFRGYFHRVINKRFWNKKIK